MNRSKFMAASACAIAFGLFTAAPVRGDENGGNSDWPVAGHDASNSRSQPNEHKISVRNAASLSVKWTFTTGGDVSATPTVADDAIYFPDWAGNLSAVQRDTGRQMWSQMVSSYDGHSGSLSRTSPAVHRDEIILGDILSGSQPHDGANVLAVRRSDGRLRWITHVDSHPAAIITGPPVVVGDIAYVGVSSNEEALAVNPSYSCCSFRASMVALDANTGRILWKTYTVPDNHGSATGYSGGAIWQPPAIDPARRTLYVGTGNNYTVPQAVESCLASSSDAQKPACFAPDDYFDTALALDMDTGRVKWARRLQGFDVWTVACIRNPNPVSCPVPSSPDFDLGGSGPNLVGGIVGFGQKSGIYWALNPDTGEIKWSSVVGPGSTLGGIEWGTATDGARIYVAITNSAHRSYPLMNGSVITWGAWSALDVASGKILWQTADPDQGLDMGAVSVANGVLYAPSFTGAMHMLDAASGRILKSFGSGGSVIDGPSIANGTVFWGSGYKRISPGTPNNKVFAFGLPDDD